MTRSKLSTKFTLHTWQLFEKEFREKYKAEEGKPFKGNVIQYVTIGVVQRKRLPDLEDVLLLIKKGNVNCGDDGAEAILEGWLNDDENRERGLAGAFSDICKDLCFDIPVHPTIKEQIFNMEDTISKMQEAYGRFNELLEKLGSITKEPDNSEIDKEKLGVDNENTQENK
jgi:hypothetical protein